MRLMPRAAIFILLIMGESLVCLKQSSLTRCSYRKVRWSWINYYLQQESYLEMLSQLQFPVDILTHLRESKEEKLGLSP